MKRIYFKLLSRYQSEDMNSNFKEDYQKYKMNIECLNIKQAIIDIGLNR